MICLYLLLSPTDSIDNIYLPQALISLPIYQPIQMCLHIVNLVCGIKFYFDELCWIWFNTLAWESHLGMSLRIGEWDECWEIWSDVSVQVFFSPTLSYSSSFVCTIITPTCIQYTVCQWPFHVKRYFKDDDYILKNIIQDQNSIFYIFVLKVFKFVLIALPNGWRSQFIWNKVSVYLSKNNFSTIDHGSNVLRNLISRLQNLHQ